MNGNDFEYDVAISFLAQDEPLANEIQTRLQPPLRVFLYSKAQERVAGTDGAESFREVFRQRSRIALVLYRPGWGETRFTRVEAAAIKDYILEAGWERLMFVRLTREGETPKWVPESYIYLDLERFTIDDLVGAVKAKASQLGATLRAQTPAERAGAIAAREAFDAETEQVLRRSPQPFHDAATALFDTLERHCGETERTTGWEMVHGGNSHTYYVIFTRGVTVQLLKESVYGSRAPGASLYVRQFAGRLLTPDERARGLDVWEKPKEKKSFRLSLHREPNVGWCWKHSGCVLTNDTAAELVMAELLKAAEHPPGED